ncbi:hypothetical protein [Terracoccus sp. 273MFTsu3.1]|uniref:hypothetical protein n=1 Tax=Terracoccus sp. 273MFTsu3.1 TaxID=1172188 RepID=UPI0012DD9600|nr:hypothetical protein [Terracoccus sp. 273MFTsu3.1]
MLVSAPYAKSRYPQRAARGDQRQPLDYAQVMALPDEISTHIVRAAGHARVWVYMLADEGAGVEILNAPLRAHHKPVRIPR